MRRDSVFWGVGLIILGILFFLQGQGYIGNIGPYIWPVALILVGAWIILGVYWRRSPSEVETFSVPLGAAQSVKYHFAHGAGQLEISGGAPAGQALVGTTAVGMNRSSHLNGDRLDLRVEAGPSFVPFIGPEQGVWRFQIAQDVPVLLNVESGASSLHIDLADVLATRFSLKTGASSANVTMPARGASILDVESGVASINIRVPDVAAARIRVKEGVMAVNIDTSRFPQLDSGLYQSANFDASQNRTEINIDSGVGSVSVK
jgi:hypothetical protein